MPVKIRLQRHGKKGKPFYWIVAADSRSKRDGKFLEKLGFYNPNTNPATIDLDIDGSVKWLQNGAQPTDTARAILSYKGALLKHHLWGGVRKGALTEEQLEKKFNAWVEEKEKAVQAKKDGLNEAEADARSKALQAEKEANEKRAAAALETEESAEETPDTEVAGDATEEIEAVEKAPEVPEEAPAAEEMSEENTEAKTVETTKVDTPEAPQPDPENADAEAVAPVVKPEVIEENADMKEAPTVNEVVTDADFEEKDPKNPQPAEEKEAPKAAKASSEEE